MIIDTAIPFVFAREDFVRDAATAFGVAEKCASANLLYSAQANMDDAARCLARAADIDNFLSTWESRV